MNQLIKSILDKRSVSFEDLTMSAEYPKLQKALSDGFGLSIHELQERAKQNELPVSLKVFNELADCCLGF